MTAPVWVATWSGNLRHHPKPDQPDRTLCGRRVAWDYPKHLIRVRPDCRRCTKGNQ